MSRQSPNRKQRSKGIKIKHVLQICLLVAICFWLIYQVRHSYDKKKEFDESDKVLLRRESTDSVIKLGRKDTHSQAEEIVSKNAEHDDQLEEEEEDENEEDAQGETNIRGNGKEGLGGEEEEEIDEHEREKLETEIDQEEDFVNDEEEVNGDQENEERHSEDSKKGVSVEDVDRDGDDTSSHEAREEHYKDDASSAVTHDTQIDRENSSEHLDLVLGKEKKEHNSEETNTSENRKELGLENGEVVRGSNGSDVTIKETLLGNSRNGSFSNNTLIEGSQHRLEVTNSSTGIRMGNHSSSLGNITESVQGNTINGSISTISAVTEGVGSKSEEFSSTSNDADSFGSVPIGTSEASMDTGDGKNDIFDSIMPEIFEQVQHDPIDFSDTSNSLEDKDVPANVDILLHGIWNQGTHTKDAAAE